MVRFVLIINRKVGLYRLTIYYLICFKIMRSNIWGATIPKDQDLRPRRSYSLRNRIQDQESVFDFGKRLVVRVVLWLDKE